MKTKKVTVVVPCHNEAEVLPEFYRELSAVMDEIEGGAGGGVGRKVIDGTIEKYRFEVILVDDGSKDCTLGIIKGLCKADARVHFITLSRNFGKEAAMLAGFERAVGVSLKCTSGSAGRASESAGRVGDMAGRTGDVAGRAGEVVGRVNDRPSDLVVVMDADLQDPPKLLPEMLRLLATGEYDCVATRRSTRAGEPKVRSFLARRFYWLINKVSKVEMVDGARDFRLMTRPVVEAIIACPEYNRYSKGLWGYVGFRTKWLEYENIGRAAGATNWSLFSLFAYAVEGIVSFSTMPLIMAAFVGMLLCLLSFIAIMVIIVKTLAFGDPVSGWPSLACIIVFMGGLQLFFLGVIGEYLAKTYLETKGRPKYFVREEG